MDWEQDNAEAARRATRALIHLPESLVQRAAVDAIPHTATGKVDYRAVETMVTGGG